MFCKKCGNELREDQKYCPKCGQTNIDIIGLYQKLKMDRDALTNKEIDVLVRDFENKATNEIEFNNAGDYLIEFIDGNQFNGVLVYKPKQHRIQDFRIEQLSGKKYKYHIDNDGKIITVCANICKYEDFENIGVKNELSKTELDNTVNIAKNKPSTINIILNVFWAIFGGLIYSLGWLLIGALWCITIIGIPLGKQCFKFAKLMLAPFGKEIVYGGNTAKVIVNIIWLIFSGLESAIAYAATGLVLCITLIGIPLGLQYFKLAKLMLMPFGAQIIEKQEKGE